MGMFDKPEPPDAGEVSQQQQQYNTQTGNQTLINNAMGRTGPFGSSQFSFDPVSGLPTGINTSLDPSLNAGAFAGNQGLLGGQLPGTTVDFSTAVGTPVDIANRNYAAYAAMTAPQRQQMQEAANVDLTNRGLPVGSEAWDDTQGNLARQFALADTSAAAQAWNAVPGMQSQMTNTAITQQNQPYMQAGLGLGLLGGLSGLAPQAQQPQASYQPVDYSGNAYKQFQGDQQNFQNMWSNIGNAAGAVGGMMFGMPPTGGGLFNGMSGLWPGSMGTAG